jgi:hypothetical protein
MPIKKSLNNPNKPVGTTKKRVKLPAKMGGVTTDVTSKGTAMYPKTKVGAVASKATVKGYKKGDVGDGKMYSMNMSSKTSDRTVFKSTAKGTKLAANKAARAAKKA